MLGAILRGLQAVAVLALQNWGCVMLQSSCGLGRPSLLALPINL